MHPGTSPSFTHRTWWWVFALFIAMPAVALAVLGFRSIRAADIERGQHLRDQQAEVARLVDEALGTALEGRRVDDAPSDDRVAFRLEDNDVLAFPAYRLYFGPFGARPSSARTPAVPPSVSRMIDEAQTAEARGRPDEARGAYEGVRAHAPLAPWADLRIAILDAEAGNWSSWAAVADVRLASSMAHTPAGIPLAIAAATYATSAPLGERARFLPLIDATLAGLRGGRWWLGANQRRAYDTELRRAAVEAGADAAAAGEDAWLSRLGAIEVLIRDVRHGQAGARARAEIVRGPDGPVLVVRETSATTSPERGAVLSAPAVGRLFDEVVGPITAARAFVTVVRTTTGDTLWGDAGASDPSSATALDAIEGAELAFTVPPLPTSTRLLNYGLVLLPIVMLAGGLVMTAWIVRRDLALARLQSTFVAAVTHEFKSPITSIRLLVERLAGGRVEPGEPADRYYAAIDAETDRLEGLVNRLLESQKLQSGRRDYAFRATSLNELVGAVVERLRPHAEARGIRIDVAMDEDMADCPVDYDSMTDAVANLIDNAIKYSPNGTTVQISLRTTIDEVRIEVADEGVGVDPADATRIFEPFYRSRRGDHANVHGTGLGLSLVKATAEAHGGSVAVASDGRRGSRFALRLPRVHDAAAATEPVVSSARLHPSPPAR